MAIDHGLAASAVQRPGCLGLLWRILRVLVGKRPGDSGCVYVPGRLTDRPDPCIYDQFMLMALGLPVTWANPDVAILLGSVPQNTYDLTASTTYDVVVTVHNSSRTRSAPGTRVDMWWMEYGAGGAVKHDVGTQFVGVPVWPGVAQAHFAWTTPSAPGHYCLEIQLFHPDDADPSNNRGQNNTQVYAAHSQVKGPIRIFNAFPDEAPAAPLPSALVAKRPPVPRHGANVTITVDGYVFVDAIGKRADPDQMFAPRDAAWPARVEPAQFTFDPGERYRDVMLIVDAPDGPGPSETFNVSVRQGGAPTGGVTVTIERT
jgi:hypothetical protein